MYITMFPEQNTLHIIIYYIGDNNINREITNTIL